MSLPGDGLQLKSCGRRSFLLHLFFSSSFDSIFSTAGDKQLLQLPTSPLYVGECGEKLLLGSLSLQLGHWTGCCFLTSSFFSSLMDSSESEDSSTTSGVLSANGLTYPTMTQLSEEEPLSLESALACNSVCSLALRLPGAESSSELSDDSRGEAGIKRG